MLFHLLLQEEFFIKFAEFEEKVKEVERARAIYKCAHAYLLLYLISVTTIYVVTVAYFGLGCRGYCFLIYRYMRWTTPPA